MGFSAFTELLVLTVVQFPEIIFQGLIQYLVCLVQSWKNAVNPALVHSKLQHASYEWCLSM